jgi:hypothetical protein
MIVDCSYDCARAVSWEVANVDEWMMTDAERAGAAQGCAFAAELARTSMPSSRSKRHCSSGICFSTPASSIARFLRVSIAGSWFCEKRELIAGKQKRYQRCCVLHCSPSFPLGNDTDVYHMFCACDCKLGRVKCFVGLVLEVGLSLQGHEDDLLAYIDGLMYV